MSRACSCGRGYRSAYDGKCGHCRTRREQKAHQDRFHPTRSVDRAAQAYGFVNETL